VCKVDNMAVVVVLGEVLREIYVCLYVCAKSEVMVMVMVVVVVVAVVVVVVFINIGREESNKRVREFVM